MCISLKFLSSLAVLAVLIIWSVPASADVNVNPIPPADVVTFDPADPPAGKPPNSVGWCHFEGSSEGSIWSGYVNGNGEYCITGVNGQISGSITIYLPEGASEETAEHEDGHDDLTRFEYDNFAEQKAEDGLAGLIGKCFSSQQEADDAFDQALEDVETAIDNQVDMINEKYDLVTDEGQSDEYGPEEGKAYAIFERLISELVGTIIWGIDQLFDTFAGTDANDATVHVEPDEHKLIFDPVTVGESSVTARDTILGAAIHIDPIQVIGPQDNGTIHLSAFRMWIEQGGETVLYAHIWEPAYMPSSKPAQPWMIQGYLDLPPDFTGAGIQNTIGSAFLEQYDSIYTNGVDHPRSKFSFYNVGAVVQRGR